MTTFAEMIQEAVNDIVEHGFDSEERIKTWQERIRAAAMGQYGGDNYRTEELLRDTLEQVYRRMIEKYGVVKYHPGIERWKIDRIRPQLRAELDRRILASANLIKLNREEQVAKTLRRFSGWATSIPAGGTDAEHKPAVKAEIKKALAQLPFSERRTAIDQGHKLTASLNAIVALDNGAIAAVWFSHKYQPGYDSRETHDDRDGKYYTIRGNWALERGLMKVGPAGYTDEITQPAEEINCRCHYSYRTTLGSLPDYMLTVKGKEELQRVRDLLQARRSA